MLTEVRFDQFGPEALQYRLNTSQASVLVTDLTNYPKVQEIRKDLPDLKHVLLIDSTQSIENNRHLKVPAGSALSGYCVFVYLIDTLSYTVSVNNQVPRHFGDFSKKAAAILEQKRPPRMILHS
jgi:hypothetical protein